MYFSDSHQLLNLQNQSSQILLDALEHIQVIKRYQFEQRYFERWKYSKHQDWNAFLNNDWMQNLMEFLLLLFKKLNWLLTLGFSIYLILKNTLSIGVFIAYWSLKIQIFSRTEISLKRMLQWQYLKAPMARIADLFLHQFHNKPAKNSVRTAIQDDGDIQIVGLALRGMRFKDLRFEHGKKYLIKGASGVGKSSLLMAIGGCLALDSGNIYYSGQVIQMDNWQRLYQDCAFVMQNESLFNASVIDNICLFAKKVNDGLLHDIFYLLELRDWVDALPQSINTLIGESNYQLSGGQIQRILLARALYRQPKWLILDEATCHLDEYSEQVLMERLTSLSISMIATNHRTGYEALFHEVLDWSQCIINLH